MPWRAVRSSTRPLAPELRSRVPIEAVQRELLRFLIRSLFRDACERDLKERFKVEREGYAGTQEK
jgi:hypothetical protein